MNIVTANQNKMEKTQEEIIREIYWIFRNAIHNGHTQIKSENGVISSYKKLEDTDCYVCDIIRNIEVEIANIFQDGNYNNTPKVEKKSNEN